MMAISPLDRMAGTFARAFRGKLHQGTLWRNTPGTGVNSHGDPTPGTWAAHSFEGIVEEYDDVYRAQAGIPQGDVKLLILAGSIGLEPTKADIIDLRGGMYQARAIGTDPAKATWTIQAYVTTMNPAEPPPEEDPEGED